MLGIGTQEMIILAFLALLLFGKRLPEVARSMGKGIVEFKKGMNGVEDEIRTSTSTSSSNYNSNASRPAVESDEQKWTAPKFDPSAVEPKQS